MKHSEKYQHFALDTNNNLININAIGKTDKEKYYCPYCHAEMLCRRGNIRQWHFAHKVSQCSYDKYLHSIAEIMIAEWFSKSESVILKRRTFEYCKDYDSCKLFEFDICKETKNTEVNLKKYYSQCLIEHGYGGYIADIYCESIDNKYPPIFLEIFVTHECTQEKKDSGIRIIELKIESEEDILDIINSEILEESPKVRLYNFKREGKSEEKNLRCIQKYILHPTFKSYVEQHYTCRNYNKKRKGIYEISVPYNAEYFGYGGLYLIGKTKAYIDGFLKKDCQICRWQAEDMMGLRFCKLYKKCGNPKYCEENDASKCSMFRINKELTDKVIAEFNDYLNEGWVEIWRNRNE